jgi:hypothetical protein
MLDFPANPTVGQIFQNWRWDGVKWVVVSGTLSEAPATPAGTIYVRQGSAPQGWVVEPNDSGRNQLHNALFNIQQRGPGPWTATAYTADRWQLFVANDTVSASVVSLSDADRTAIGDEAATYALQTVFNGSPTSGAFTEECQHSESVKRLAGKTVTVSFYARATSGTPRIGVGYLQVFGNGGSPSANVGGNIGVTPALSSTWQRYSFTGALPSTSGKVLGTTLGSDYLRTEFWLSDQGAGAARSGGIGVQAGTVQFWGMQLEVGSTATPLEKLDPQVDLARCQRFYQVGGVHVSCAASAVVNGWTWQHGQAFPVTMRALPTMIVTGTAGATNATSPSFAPASDNTSFFLQAQISTTTGGYGLYATYSASADL